MTKPISDTARRYSRRVEAGRSLRRGWILPKWGHGLTSRVLPGYRPPSAESVGIRSRWRRDARCPAPRARPPAGGIALAKGRSRIYLGGWSESGADSLSGRRCSTPWRDCPTRDAGSSTSVRPRSTEMKTLSTVALVFAALLAIISSQSAFASTVVRDHLGGAILDQGPFQNWVVESLDMPSRGRAFARGITSFVGNGEIIESYTSFFSFSSSALPNLSTGNFRVRFWSNQSLLESDPVLFTPVPGTRFASIGTPINPDALTPVAVNGLGVLHRLEFSLLGVGIQTTPGQRHFMAVTWDSPDFSQGVVPASIMLSDGRSGTFGIDPGFTWAIPGMGSPPGLNQLVAPYSIADRITTVPTPSAASLALLFIGVFVQRKRGRL